MDGSKIRLVSALDQGGHSVLETSAWRSLLRAAALSLIQPALKGIGKTIGLGRRSRIQIHRNRMRKGHETTLRSLMPDQIPAYHS